MLGKNVQPYHLRVGSDVEREDSGCQSTEELRTVPHWGQVRHVVVKIPKELHEGDRVLPQPGAFLLWLPRLERDTRENKSNHSMVIFRSSGIASFSGLGDLSKVELVQQHLVPRRSSAASQQPAANTVRFTEALPGVSVWMRVKTACVRSHFCWINGA